MQRRLLAVIGLSPQVLTETLYALHEQGRMVSAIDVITTRLGKERIYSSLLAQGSGYFYRFLAEYGYASDAVEFSPSRLHVVKREDNSEIDDIITEEDNERVLGTCFRLAWECTSDDSTAVYFSIAGGRKTMSACLACAAQLYARAQDRIYHVLISPEFERHETFFYPPAEPRLIELKDAKGELYFKSTAYSGVTLAHLPFVSVRSELPTELLADFHEPSRLLSARIVDERAGLYLDVDRRTLRYKRLECELPAAQFALFSMFVFARLGHPELESQCQRGALSLGDIASSVSLLNKLYAAVATQRSDAAASSGIRNLTPENFNSYKSKINRALLQCFGAYEQRDLRIERLSGSEDTCWGLALEPERIQIKWKELPS